MGGRVALVALGAGVGLGYVAGLLFGPLALGLFVAALGLTILHNVWEMRSYRCPDCASTLTPPKGWWIGGGERKILLECARCDINWDFRLRAHNED